MLSVTFREPTCATRCWAASRAAGTRIRPSFASLREIGGAAQRRVPAIAAAQQQPQQPQAAAPATTAGGGATSPAGTWEEVEPQWNDVVEYVLPRAVAGATLGIGRVDAVADGRVTVAPLEEEDDVWVESHEEVPAVLPRAAILRVLNCDYSQRQDRESNPHGEHAHDVYTLLDPPSASVYRGPRTLKVVTRSGEWR